MKKILQNRLKGFKLRLNKTGKLTNKGRDNSPLKSCLFGFSSVLSIGLIISLLKRISPNQTD